MSDDPKSAPATDLMRMLSEFRLPAVPDVESLAAAQRRNFEALSAANRIALEGAQAVARRHMEILQQSMAELSEAMRTASATGSPQEKASNQAELLKATYGRAVANMQEIADLIQKSNGEALALLNKRFTEAMDEVKGLIAKSGGEGPPA
ncbi:phasin family protein [Pseudoroseomonas ludipueritiae]|uniref:Phasin family protein n=1 Tax=Pseudoroseomonas ludipueritiae TaxID=198093 RepID=A0ABR7R9A7_9PROT|nr:TIGR01841 family phasin [Pseudoroseomonas ludipueritiae]MBC9178399.1 phasin family protein [Pseudoroseomonas ludipueritiae]MCG7361177.1 TIGR01841 family phasin [Roseomonas sp. ACRSG]